MAKFIVLTIDRNLASEDTQIALMRGWERAETVARRALNEGLYMPKYRNFFEAETAAEAFDKLNTSEDGSTYMGVGDVILWLSGQREVCLADSWAIV